MFDKLPIELLQYVFMMLSPCVDFPNVLLVCKRWYSVCKEVIKLRKDKCSSAFKLESPLRWIIPKVVSTGSSTHLMPSKRFGSTVLFRGSSVYVFGGATSMFTTFNDLWIYDLGTKFWKRVPCGGELPAPRAHAKGSFIGDSLYLFGGCHSLHHTGGNHSGQIHWLNDLKSFDTKHLRWSAITLKLADSDLIQNPPVNGGQSGCFLPESPDGLPNLLILFGGISRTSGSCVNSLCFIDPVSQLWYTERDTDFIRTPSPSGRCGHAVCALDANRMLVLLGNRESVTSAESSAVNEQQPSVNGENGRSYQGHPAGDIWILTRFRSHVEARTGSNRFSTTWYWSKVQCPINFPGCPPIDFYHSIAIRLPYIDKKDEHSDDPDSTVACTVLCVSQCTEKLLEEAARQRRCWRQRRPRSVSSCDAPLKSSIENPVSPSDLNESKRGRTESLCSDVTADLTQPCCSTETSSSSELITVSPTTLSGSLTANRRSIDRRAKRLEALAAQERRLFGSRSTSSRSDHISQSSTETDNNLTCQDEPSLTQNPMAVYSLRLLLPQTSDSAASVLGTWLIPKKLNYLDLLHGPHDCLGFSCTFGSGCLFLFGGLSESDESVSNQHDSRPNTDSSNHLYMAHEVHEPYEISLKQHSPCSLRKSKSSARTASFYALQPQGLVGTLV